MNLLEVREEAAKDCVYLLILETGYPNVGVYRLLRGEVV